MFKYRLRIVNKQDDSELAVLKRSVYGIHQYCIDFAKWLTDGFKLEQETIHKITVDIEALATLIDIYHNNKYSSPANTLQMFNVIDTIRKNGMMIISMISDSIKINNHINNMTDIDDPEMLQEKYDRHREMMNKRIDRCVDDILNALKFITVMIEHDLIKITLGVDIIADHKSRKKRFLKNKEIMSKFTIHYKMLSPGDRKFLEKENSKNAK